MRDFTVVDLETTGLRSETDRIIEIGAAKVRNGIVVDTFSTFVDPHRPVPERISELTGITDTMLCGAPDIREVMPSFLAFAGEDVLLGHNLMFDFRFLKQNAVNLSLPFERKGVDTLKIARSVLESLESRRLDYLCTYYGIEDNNHHRALNDVLVTWELYRRLREQFYGEHPDLFEAKELQYGARKQSPATQRQIAYLKALLARHGIVAEVPVESMTKNEASRMVDQILSQYGRG